MQPVRHTGSIECPRFFDMLVSLPIILLAVKELLAMTLVFYYLVSFKAVLIPVIVLLAVAFPFFRGITLPSDA